MSAEKQSADTLYYHFAQQLTKIKIKEETTISYLVCHMEKYHIVKENNREVARLEKRKIRHESIYSLEAITEENGVEMIDGTTDIAQEPKQGMKLVQS